MRCRQLFLVALFGQADAVKAIGVTSGHKTERLARRVTHLKPKAAKSKAEIGKAAQ